MPVRFLLEKLPVQCQGIIDADPFLIPTKKYPASISAEDQKRLTEQVTDAINSDVIPAYKTFAASCARNTLPQTVLLSRLLLWPDVRSATRTISTPGPPPA